MFRRQLIAALGTGAALLPISVLPVGVIIGLIFVVKVIGANLVRFYRALGSAMDAATCTIATDYASPVGSDR